MSASALALRILTSSEIARAVCLGDFFRLAEPAKAQLLWNAGIYDADVEFFTADTSLTEGAARRALADSGAKSRRSFAFGACPAKSENANPAARSWIAAFRAHAALVVADGKISMPAKAECRNFLVRSIGPSGRSTGLKNSPDGRIEIPSMDGTVTITCSHDENTKTMAAVGPELWFTIPTGKGPSAEVPGRSAIPAKSDFSAAVIAWVNHLRAAEKLSPVTPVTLRNAPDLTRHASALHDRKQLAKIAELAKKQLRLKLSGEDRVVAKTRDDALWLLWNSPRHRDLLLAPEASRILIQTGMSGSGGTLVASLIFFSSR